MIQSLLNDLKASIRDIILAGVAAAAGVFLATEVIPKSWAEVKILAAGCLWAGLRACVAYVAVKLSA